MSQISYYKEENFSRSCCWFFLISGYDLIFRAPEIATNLDITISLSEIHQFYCFSKDSGRFSFSFGGLCRYFFKVLNFFSWKKKLFLISYGKCHVSVFRNTVKNILLCRDRKVAGNVFTTINPDEFFISFREKGGWKEVIWSEFSSDSWKKAAIEI